MQKKKPSSCDEGVCCSEGLAPFILNWRTRCGQTVTFTPRAL